MVSALVHDGGSRVEETTHALVDTGAEESCINLRLARRLRMPVLDTVTVFCPRVAHLRRHRPCHVLRGNRPSPLGQGAVPRHAAERLRRRRRFQRIQRCRSRCPTRFLVAFHAVPVLNELGRPADPAAVLALAEVLWAHCGYAGRYLHSRAESPVATEKQPSADAPSRKRWQETPPCAPNLDLERCSANDLGIVVESRNLSAEPQLEPVRKTLIARPIGHRPPPNPNVIPGI